MSSSFTAQAKALRKTYASTKRNKTKQSVVQKHLDASLVQQSKGDLKTAGPVCTLASTLGSAQSGSTPFSFPATPTLNKSDIAALNTAGINLGLFGNGIPVVLQHLPHWMQLLRIQTLANKMYSAMKEGRASRDYDGLLQLCRRLVCEGGTSMTSLGLVWMGTSHGRGIDGANGTRNTAVRTTTSRSNYLGSVPTNEGSSKMLADVFVFIYEFYFRHEEDAGGHTDASGVLATLQTLLAKMGFDFERMDTGDNSLGNFSTYLSNPVGKDDLGWGNTPPLNAVDTAVVVPGLVAASLCVATLLNPTVDMAQACGSIGNISVLELAVIARSLTFDLSYGDTASTFDMLSPSAVTRLLNNLNRASRHSIAYLVEPLLVTQSCMQAFESFIRESLTQLVSDDVLEHMCGGRFHQLSVMHQLYSDLTRLNTARSAETATPRDVREINDGSGRCIGAMFDQNRVMFADFGVAYTICMQSILDLINEVSTLFGGDVMNALRSLARQKVTALGRDEHGYVTCSVEVGGIEFTFARVSSAAKRVAERWQVGSTARTTFQRLMSALREHIAVGLMFFTGAIGRGTDTASIAVEHHVGGSPGTNFATIQQPATVQKIEVVVVPTGAKLSSVVATQVHPLDVSTPITLGILSLRMLLDAQRTLIPSMSSMLLLRTDGNEYTATEQPSVILSALYSIVGDVLPPLQVLDFKRLEGVLSAVFANICSDSSSDSVYNGVLQVIGSGQGHSQSTHALVYSQRTYSDQSSGSASEQRRRKGALVLKEYCNWRCAGVIGESATLHDLSLLAPPPMATGCSSLVDFAMRVFPCEERAASVRMLVEVMSPTVAQRFFVGVRDATLRTEQIDAIIEIIVRAGNGESGVLIQPMGAGKTLIIVAVALILDELRQLDGSSAQLSLFGRASDVIAAAVALREIPLQLIVVCCAFQPLTTQIVKVCGDARLEVQLLRGSATIKDTAQIVVIAPEVIVTTHAVVQLHRVQHRVCYAAFDEIIASLQSQHWRICFARLKGAMASLKIPRVLVSGTVPPSVVTDLAELVGLGTNVPLYEQRLSIMHSRMNMWQGLHVGLLEMVRSPQDTLISRTAQSILSTMETVIASRDWDESSVVLVVVDTVLDTHSVAKALNSAEDVRANAVHRPKPRHMRHISGCTEDPCAMSDSSGECEGDLRSVVNDLLENNAASHADGSMYCIVTTGAVAGLDDKRIQAVFSTPLYSIVDLFQALLRSHRVRNRSSWAFMLSTDDHQSLGGTQPARPRATAYAGAAAPVLVAPWGGGLIMSMIRDAIAVEEDEALSSAMAEMSDEQQDTDDYVIDASTVGHCDIVTDLFTALHMMLFEASVHSSLQRHTRHFGHTAAGLLELLKCPVTYDDASNSFEHDGDLEILPQMPIQRSASLALTVEDRNILLRIGKLSSSGMCLHCCQHCYPTEPHLQPGHICASVLTNGCKRCLEEDASPGHSAQSCGVVDFRPLAEGQRLCYLCFSPHCERIIDLMGMDDEFPGVGHACFGARTYSLLMCVFKYRAEWLQTQYSLSFQSRNQYLCWLQQIGSHTRLFNFHRVMADYFQHFVTQFSQNQTQLTLRAILLRPVATITPSLSFVTAAVEEMIKLTTDDAMET
jgi:hypothetical protein